MCSTPNLSWPATIAAPTLELNATCCTSSIFILQATSMVRSAIERAPPTESTPTGAPFRLSQVAPASIEPISQSGCSMPQMPTSFTSVFATWLMMSGEGESATAISPDATAREAAAPVSNARTATSTPCFLKKPSLSATIAMVPPKTGGMPGMPKVSFCCAAQSTGNIIKTNIAHAVRMPPDKLLCVMVYPSFVVDK